MPGEGTGVLQQIALNSGAVTIAGNKIEGFSRTPAPDTVGVAAGFEVERGSLLERLTFTCLDYSAVATMIGYMTARTEIDAVVTYPGSKTATWDPVILTVTPQLLPVGGVQKVLLGAAAADATNLVAGTGWTDLGACFGTPEPSFEVVAGEDGQRRSRYNFMRLALDVLLPDVQASDISGTFDHMEEVKLALQLKSGLYLVFSKVYVSWFYGEENAEDPLHVRLRVTGTDPTPGNLFQYHDGSTAAVADPGDYLQGASVEAVGFARTQSDLLTFS